MKKMFIYLNNRKMHIGEMIKSSKKIPPRKDTALQQSQGNYFFKYIIFMKAEVLHMVKWK